VVAGATATAAGGLRLKATIADAAMAFMTASVCCPFIPWGGVSILIPVSSDALVDFMIG
jgi:hypothetical protein